MKLLSKINAEGKTVIVTTHNRDIIKEHSGRVLEVKKGTLVKDTLKEKKHHEKTN
jgi:ABC-type ATPase involved in cell division